MERRDGNISRARRDRNISREKRELPERQTAIGEGIDRRSHFSGYISFVYYTSIASRRGGAVSGRMNDDTPRIDGALVTA
jgi:hypothetical protein